MNTHKKKILNNYFKEKIKKKHKEKMNKIKNYVKYYVVLFQSDKTGFWWRMHIGSFSLSNFLGISDAAN